MESGDSRWDKVFKPQPPRMVERHEPQTDTAKADASTGEEDLGACAARPMPGGWLGIYIFNGREDTHAFQYMHMGLERFSSDGRSFVIEFNINVSEKWRVTVQGRKLWPIFVNLHHHKLEWIKKADRDFVDNGRLPVITDIAVEFVQETEAGSPKVVSLRPERMDEDTTAMA
jgi:hypothetical protein